MILYIAEIRDFKLNFFDNIHIHIKKISVPIFWVPQGHRNDEKALKKILNWWKNRTLYEFFSKRLKMYIPIYRTFGFRA